MILPITISIIMEDKWTEYSQRVTSPVDPRIHYRVNNLNECPEDAIIGRDLVSAYEWLDAVRLGMELAREGVTELEVTEERKNYYDDEV